MEYKYKYLLFKLIESIVNLKKYFFDKEKFTNEIKKTKELLIKWLKGT